MRALDLFSGIGGMALALKGYVRPILYCDIDEPCRSVLAERMRKGDIERAPVHCDVRTLFAAHLEPEAIVGGFPCQDTSSMGNNEGLGGARSSLFLQILRLIDETPSVRVVFLENVANIVHCDLDVVLRELHERGFAVHWTTRSADEHGAPHVRARWFGLAHRGPVGDIGAEGNGAMAQWPPEPIDRCALRPAVGEDANYDPNWARRARMLGNSLVPCVARGAFEYLVRSASLIEPMRLVAPLIGSPFEAPAAPAAQQDTAPDAPAAHQDTAPESPEAAAEVPDAPAAPESPAAEVPEVPDAAPEAQPLPEAPTLPRDATLVDGIVVCHKRDARPAPCAVDTSVDDGADLVHVPTPRHGNVYGGPASERNLRFTLGVFLVNCRHSRARALESGARADVPMHKQLVPNPRYIEWMMGFPQDWTRFDDEPVERARTPRRRGPSAGAGGAAGAAGADESGEPPARLPPLPPAPKQFRRNGMHLLMTERGLGVRAASAIWRALSVDERASYSVRAKTE
jgi:hypothetical protein